MVALGKDVMFITRRIEYVNFFEAFSDAVLMISLLSYRRKASTLEERFVPFSLVMVRTGASCTFLCCYYFQVFRG